MTSPLGKRRTPPVGLTGVTCLLATLPALAAVDDSEALELHVSLVVAVFPLLVHMWMSFLNQRSWLVPEPTLAVATTLTTFLYFGVAGHINNPYQRFVGGIGPEGADLVVTLSALSFLSGSFVAGLHSFRKANVRPRDSVDAWRTLSNFGAILVLLTLLGIVLTVLDYGSLDQARLALATHRRSTYLDEDTGIGLALTNVFAVPATAIGLLCFRRRSFMGKVAAGGGLASIVVFAVTVQGSRLAIALAIAMWLGMRCLHDPRPMRVRYAIAGAALALVASVWVLNVRADLAGTGGTEQSVTNALSYSVVDVATTLRPMRAQLATAYTDPSRLPIFLTEAIPLTSVNSAEEINAARVDVITARYVLGYSAGSDTGLPPSLPTYNWISFGVLIGAVLIFLQGLLLGWFVRWLGRRRSPFGIVAYGVGAAFLINLSKDGDLLANASGEAKRLFYLAAVYTLAAMTTSRRTKTLADPIRRSRSPRPNADVRRPGGRPVAAHGPRSSAPHLDVQ